MPPLGAWCTRSHHSPPAISGFGQRSGLQPGAELSSWRSSGTKLRLRSGNIHQTRKPAPKKAGFLFATTSRNCTLRRPRFSRLKSPFRAPCGDCGSGFSFSQTRLCWKRDGPRRVQNCPGHPIPIQPRKNSTQPILKRLRIVRLCRENCL